MKKIVFFGIFGAFLMLLGNTVALAQETKESNLTPRQILLLLVPDGYGIEVDNMRWSVVMEDGKPKEEIIYSLPDTLDVITIGAENKVEKFVRFAVFPSLAGPNLVPSIAGKLIDNKIVIEDVLAAAIGVQGIPLELLNAVGKDIVAEAKEVLIKFGIETDEELATLIKKSVTGKKAAVDL